MSLEYQPLPLSVTPSCKLAFAGSNSLLTANFLVAKNDMCLRASLGRFIFSLLGFYMISFADSKSRSHLDGAGSGFVCC